MKLKIHIVENGYKVNITQIFDEDILDSLRDCIYDLIPDHAKLCIYTCVVSNLNCHDFEVLKDAIYKITPKHKKWKENIRIIFKDENQTQKDHKIIQLKPYKEKRKKARKQSCTLCKRSGHNRRTCITRNLFD